MRRLLAFVAMGIVALSAGSAVAQDGSAPDARQFTRTRLERVCSVSLARFCPDLTATPGQTRNQVICLKPYRTSLPLACRSAVTAALH